MQRPILFVLLLALAGIIILSWITYRNNQHIQNTQYWIGHTYEVIKNIDNIANTITTAESKVRDYVITNDSALISSYTDYANNIFTEIQATQKLIADNPEQTNRFIQLKKYLTTKLSFQEKIIAAKKNTDVPVVKLVASPEDKTLRDSIIRMVNEMKNAENTLLQKRIQNSQKTSQNSLQTILITGGVVILFVLILLLHLNRDIRLRRQAEAEVRVSEMKYRQFIENAGVVTYTANINGNFTFISPQVVTLTGYSEEELMGKHFSILVRPDWRQRVIGKYQNQFINNIKETSFTFPIQTKNKIIRWVEQDAIMVMKDRKINAFQCVVKDVTKRVMAEEKLKQIEEDQKAYQFRLQAILDNTPLIIYVKDLNGQYTLVNKRFKETFGLQEENVLGKTAHELENQPTEKYSIADKKVIETLKPIEMEDILHLKDGPHYLLTVKFPLFDQHKKLFGVCGIMKDITEMVQYREELIAARQKAENAEMLQEQFLANMSHEIRTPMNGIIGMTNLLLNTKLSKQQQEYIQIIKQSSDNLLVLINDILDLSKIKSGKITLEQISFNLKETVQPLITSFRLKAAEKGIVFSSSIDTHLPEYIQGDPYRLVQILNNLLCNAIKFTEKGMVKLTIARQMKEKEIIDIGFTITDTGIGIEEKQLDYIFEGFAQASSYTTRKFGGTGLGLAITKKLIELQGGIITVTSKPEKGSTFFFVLPFTAINNPISASPKQTSTTNLYQQTYEGKKVLIVEDNEINQQVLQLSLNRYKINSTIASNGKEAIHILEKDTQFDLILMDLRMPEMDGYQTTDYIRSRLLLTTPIIILTASALRNERQKSIELGANEYVTKPFAPKDLQDCLHRYLSENYVPQKRMSTAKEKSKNKLYDLTMLFELGDADSIKTVYNLFEESVPASLEILKQCALRENWNDVYEQAHKLKSSLSAIQIEEVINNMINIEEKAKSSKGVDQVLQLISRSIEKVNHVIPMIKLEIEKYLNRKI